MAISTQFDMTAAQAVLKELYDGQTVQNMVYADNPFLALVPKRTNFVGKYFPQPIKIGNSQGRSATFARAQANISSTIAKEFLVTRAKDYSIYQIDNETMMASASDKGAFVEGLKFHADSAWDSITNSMAAALFRSGTGSIGQVSTISTGVITLANAGDVVQFELNQVLNATATDGGSARGASGYVVAVDRSAGTVTVSATAGGSAGTPASWAAGDYLVTDGDLNAKMSGLEAWIPSANPTSSPFFGVDRSVDPVRLAGLRYDASSQSIEEGLIDACALLAREGGKPGHFMTNPLSYAALEKSLGSKVQYADLKMGEIGFRGIQINAPTGVVNVIADRSCPAKKGYLLTMSSWQLKSLGEAPQILNYGDGNMLRLSGADAAEGRIGFYGNLVCSAPGFNANVTLGA